MIEEILGIASVGSSLLGDALDRSAAKKAKDDAIKAWKALLIPNSDTVRRADMYGDNVYTKAMGEINEGAFKAASALNPEVLRTIAFSKTAAARSQTETAVTEEDFRYNKGIQQQIAQIQAQPLPTFDVTGAIGAGVGGYLGGKQLSMSEGLMTMQGKYLEALTKDVNNYGLHKSNTMKKLGIDETVEEPSINMDYYGQDEEIDYFGVDENKKKLRNKMKAYAAK